MNPIYHYTKRQLEIETLINQQGFRTQLEVPVGRFCVDILVPELSNLVVEVDGPQHYDRQRENREKILREFGLNYFIYVPVSLTDEEFKTLFNTKLEEYFGKRH